MKRIVNGLLIALALGLLLTGCGQSEQQEESTNQAALTSGLFTENMDLSVRPQDNFSPPPSFTKKQEERETHPQQYQSWRKEEWFDQF